MNNRTSHINALLLASLLLFWCSSCISDKQDLNPTGYRTATDQTGNSTGNQVSNNNLPVAYQLYENNPKMIAAYAGELTQNDWYLRFARSGERTNKLSYSLQFYFTHYNTYPGSWNNLEQSGFYAIRPLDPVDETPIIYNVSPTSLEDFTHVEVEPGMTSWILRGMKPNREGVWEEKDLSVIDWPSASDLEMFEDFRRCFPNITALRGFSLAEELTSVLRDYEHRRREFPSTHEQLMDGLWYPHYEWTQYDETINPDEPGAFIFGLRDDYPIAVARWVDESGKIYTEAWAWSERPRGWGDGPYTTEREIEYAALPFNPPEVSYIPPVILWRCRLPLTSQTQ